MVPAQGFERRLLDGNSKNIEKSEGDASPKVTESASKGPETDRVGPPSGPVPDVVDLALARALEGAATAGEWALVGKLAGELEARRAERAR
jgi:hypothetical protein